MKILYIANIRLPTEKAHGLQIMKMCEAFAREGVQVELVVPNRKNLIQSDPYRFYSVAKIFGITTISVPDRISFGRVGAMYSALRFAFSIKRHCNPENSVIYTRDPIVGLFFRQCVFELHDLPIRINVLRAWLLKRASLYIVKTKYLKASLVGLGIAASKIEIVFNGVDIENFNIQKTRIDARREIDLPENKKIVLYSGTFYIHDWKGVNTLLSATKEFSKNILTVLIGGSIEEVQQIRKQYPSDTVMVIERIPNKNVPLYLKAADVLVLPNKKNNRTSEFYTSPLKLFEYMASKTPIVASNIPAIQEVVGKEEVFLFEANDPHSLALVVKDVLHDSELGKIKALRAFERIEQYSWTNQAKKILGFINQSS